MTETTQPSSARLVAFIGSYGTPPVPGGGGIHVLDVSRDGRRLVSLSRATEPQEAGYLLYTSSTRTLFAVDERKNDGRGPVEPEARVHSLAVDQADGALTWLSSRLAPGPRPTFLSAIESARLLVTANHGDFQHVERVVKGADGSWGVEYFYDDSTVLLYEYEDDGQLGDLRDVRVMSGHGRDPNSSPQNGGHAQASSHAHCAVVDPSEQYVVVCDKGTDVITVFTLGLRLEVASTLHLPDETGPRHLAFDPLTGRAYVTCEFASDLASFDFDPATGELTQLDRVSTLGVEHEGLNEPADVRVHPNGRFVYVNNRGEDSLAWFAVDDAGRLERRGHVPLATSVHPGLAARSFSFDPSGTFLLVADRPADLVRSYAVDPDDGSLQHLTDIHVPSPAYVCFAELG